MADSETKSELLSEVRLPNNDTIRKWQNTDGNVRYTRNGQFVSPQVGKGLEETTELGGPIQVPEGEITQSELSDHGIRISGEELRNTRIKNKYRNWDDYEGISTRVIPGGEENKTERWIQGWMENNEVEQSIRNDPLLESDRERRQAREALAREIVGKLQEVQSRDDAIQVLREYGIY